MGRMGNRVCALVCVKPVINRLPMLLAQECRGSARLPKFALLISAQYKIVSAELLCRKWVRWQRAGKSKRLGKSGRPQPVSIKRISGGPGLRSTTTMQRKRKLSNAGLSKAGADRLERILSAASLLLERDGLNGLTMRNLAKDSGVSPVTLYNRFGSKDNIVSLVVINSFDRNIDLNRQSADRSRSPFDHLLILIDLLEHELRDKRAFSQPLMTLLFKTENESDLPNTVYRMLKKRVSQSILDMRLADELIEWASPEGVATEISDRILGTAMKWTQKAITDRQLLASLRFSVLSTLHAFVAPRLQTRVADLLRELSLPSSKSAGTPSPESK